MIRRTLIKRLTLALPGLLAGWSLAAAAPQPPSTPLAEAELFISPCGEPFRSKPGEPYPVLAWFQDTDRNKDGRIDRAEFRAEAERFFHVLDVNGDGVIEDQEIAYYERRLVPEISAGVEGSALRSAPARPPRLIRVQTQIPEPVDPGGPNEDVRPPKASEDDGPPQGAAPYELLNDPEPVRSADRSLSGRITLADFLARADHNFDALDGAGRGYLTLDSLPQTPVQQLARAARGR